jgi:hypothetical protein
MFLMRATGQNEDDDTGYAYMTSEIEDVNANNPSVYHKDIVQAVCYVPAIDKYATGSRDGSFRQGLTPVHLSAQPQPLLSREPPNTPCQYTQRKMLNKKCSRQAEMWTSQINLCHFRY